MNVSPLPPVLRSGSLRSPPLRTGGRGEETKTTTNILTKVPNSFQDLTATTCGLDFLSVREFRGWANVFARFKVLTEAYLEVSRTRGDVFATAFLLDIRERCDRAQERAVM